MNCRIKTLFVILFFLVGCQGYDDQEPIQRTAAQGVVAMDETEEEDSIGLSEEEIFQQQVSAGGSMESATASAWSASGVLVTGNLEGSVQLQADFPVSGPYTLQFSLEIPEGTDGDISVIAEIDWKVEGNWVHRVVSVRSGTAISGTAEACRVILRDRSWAVPGNEYRASVQIGTGTRGATSQPPIYSPYPGTITLHAVDVDVLVPRNCGIVAVWMFGLDYAAPAAPVTPAAGKVIGIMVSDSIVVGYMDLTNPKWYPIPPGVVKITIHNSTGNTVIVNAPMFGIEG